MRWRDAIVITMGLAVIAGIVGAMCSGCATAPAYYPLNPAPGFGETVLVSPSVWWWEPKALVTKVCDTPAEGGKCEKWVNDEKVTLPAIGSLLNAAGTAGAITGGL